VPTTAGTPRAPAAPAPASARYTVVAAEVEHNYQATEVVERLGGTGRRPTVVSRWSSRTGTRYLVVTLTGATAARAQAERDALRTLGYTPRLERSL
jgi:hypothetical protein